MTRSRAECDPKAKFRIEFFISSCPEEICGLLSACFPAGRITSAAQMLQTCIVQLVRASFTGDKLDPKERILMARHLCIMDCIFWIL